MRVFITGATGAIGKSLVPMLVASGHEVTGTTTTESKLAQLREAGAEGVVLDALDRDAVLEAVKAAQPDVVVHQATGLAGIGNPRKMAAEFGPTNRLRTEGTDHLIEAAQAAGARVVAQSFAGWPFKREGGSVKDEDAPLDDDPPSQMREILGAIRHLETAVTAADGIVLRYGGFYGPGTGMSRDGAQTQAVLKRQFPIVGDGGGVWSLIHIDDAASATVAAIEHGEPGVYNVVDDEPARVREFLPVLADAVGAKPPRRLPKWLIRLFAGEAMVIMLTDIRGASNDKAKRELGWKPAHPTWREGFRELGAGASPG
jgi:nucleoside-diphosphate-sugar epimerase